MTPIITPLNYTYKKPDTEVWVLNFDDIPVPTEKVHDRQVVHLAPQSVGGNHKHPRTEWFIGIGELELIWLDEEGAKHSAVMNPDDQIILFEVPPFLPHAVKNTSSTERAVLLEFADGKMVDVEKIIVE